MAGHAVQLGHPGGQCSGINHHRHRGRGEVARCGAGRHARRIVTELLQCIDEPRQGPCGQRRGLAPLHQRRQARPQRSVDALPGPLERLLRLSAGGGEHHCRVGDAMLRQPVDGHCSRRQGDRQALAAAADGGQQGVRRCAAQHEARLAGRLFERFEQGVGRDAVHAFRRVHHDHLAPAARRRGLRKLDGPAHRIDLDFLARLGLAGLVGGVIALTAGRGPAQRFTQRIGQQHQHVGVGMGQRQAATRAGPTGPRGAVGGLAQPSLCQRQAQLELAHALRPVHEQRVGVTGPQRLAQRRCEPRQRQHAVGAYHPRASSVATTCAHTPARSAVASISAKRCGAACRRAA